MVPISREFVRRIYLRDRVIFFTILAALAAQIINWAIMLWRGLPLLAGPYLPLHYTIYFGVDLIGPGYGLFFPALFGFLVLILNIVFIGITYEWQRLLAHVFAFGTAFAELILLAASVFMLLLNL